MTKRLLLIFAILFFSSKMASAQTFSKGDNLVELGVGFGGGYGTPVILNYERGIVDISPSFALGIGGMAGFGAKKHSDDLRSRYTLVGFTTDVHYVGLDRADFYGGVILGGEMVSVKETTTSKKTYSGSDFLFDVHVGGRYFFSDNIGAMLQLGIGTVTCKMGVTFKF